MQLILQEKQITDIIKAWAVDNLPTFSVENVRFDFGSRDLKVFIDLDSESDEKKDTQ